MLVCPPLCLRRSRIAITRNSTYLHLGRAFRYSGTGQVQCIQQRSIRWQTMVRSKTPSKVSCLLSGNDIPADPKLSIRYQGTAFGRAANNRAFASMALAAAVVSVLAVYCFHRHVCVGSLQATRRFDSSTCSTEFYYILCMSLPRWQVNDDGS